MSAVPAEYFLRSRMVIRGGTGLGFLTETALAQYVRCYTLKRITGSCRDCRATATCDFAMDTADKDRKLAIPLLLLWGARGHSPDRARELLDIRAQYADNIAAFEAMPCGRYMQEEMSGVIYEHFRRFFVSWPAPAKFALRIAGSRGRPAAGVYRAVRTRLYLRGMGFRTILFAAMLCAAAAGATSAVAADATDEPALPAPVREPSDPADAPRFGDGVRNNVRAMINKALDLVGIRYRRGGANAETGFDCSGFVGYVVHEALGFVLPRTSRELSRAGEPVEKDELQPGDLVFFKTMRHAVSHVGIYLGDNQFVHAPRPGSAVRIEDLRDRYWAKRYNSARRIERP